MEHRQEESVLDEKELLRCCGSTKFAKEMALASPFSSFDQSFSTARHIWFNLVDVNCWVEAFKAHPQIGLSAAPQWSKAEQSTALATSTESSLQELTDWNARYRLKFGIVSLICASGRTTAEILTELKKRYSNRPIIELEIAAQEQMKITELRMAKLFSAKAKDSSSTSQYSAAAKKAEDPVSIKGHLCVATETSAGKTSQILTRTRPPITTHVFYVSQGSPTGGVKLHLERHATMSLVW